MRFVSAIIAAGGIGARMKLNMPKQFYRLSGKTILEYAAKPFGDSELISEIIIVTLPECIEICREELRFLQKPLKVVKGGETRQQSVYNGLLAANDSCELAVVHDGARPFVTVNEISAVVNAADNCAAVIGTRVSETIKFVNPGGFVESTPERNRLWAMQTPQAIPYGVFMNAYKKADETGFSATDDVTLAELVGCPVKVIEGSGKNLKITSETDLLLARTLANL